MKTLQITAIAFILSVFILSCLSCSTSGSIDDLRIDKIGDTLRVYFYHPVCSDCGMYNCIYQEINANVKGDGTDTDIYNSVMEVCKKRGITDSCTIELILSNYYL